MLNDMMNAEKESDAIDVFRDFQYDFYQKYPKAVKCLVDDWNELTSFFSFPAEHWQHLKTTNPIESAFATIKLRTITPKGAGNKEMAEVMAFKLLMEAEKSWRKIRGFHEIKNLISGAIYKDGDVMESADKSQEQVASSSTTF